MASGILADVHALALLGFANAMGGGGVGGGQRHAYARSDAVLVGVVHVVHDGGSALNSRVKRGQR